MSTLSPKDRLFVVVSGLPGSGKSTLARRLASRLALPLIDKDDILERLFEAKGIGDVGWRRTLSRESDVLLEREARESAGAVIASFWHLPGMPIDSGTPTGWLLELSDLVLQVRCVCPPEFAAARFFGRRRHRGHLDAASTYEEILASLQAQAGFGFLSIEPAIEVDTSREVNVDAVVRAVADAARGRST